MPSTSLEPLFDTAHCYSFFSSYPSLFHHTNLRLPHHLPLHRKSLPLRPPPHRLPLRFPRRHSLRLRQNLQNLPPGNRTLRHRRRESITTSFGSAKIQLCHASPFPSPGLGLNH